MAQHLAFLIPNRWMLVRRQFKLHQRLQWFPWARNPTNM